MMIALFTFPAGTVLAATSCTHYVSTTGNDSNPGTLAAPWRTVQKAANTASPGNVVCVRGGSYNERVTINVSGSATGGVITLHRSHRETGLLDGTKLMSPSAFCATL